jgi:nucleotide-binding universal stress UspA family protein
MNERTRILIPLDGSVPGDAVLIALLPLVRSRQVEVTLLHVAELSSVGDGMAKRLEMQRKELEESGIPARAVIVPGKPAEEILRQSAIGDFDLIAMATHGRSGLDRVLMGSVAEEVVRSSTVATLLCKAGTRIGRWERIVVALDGTPGAEEILEDAARLARLMNATIHLLQVGLGLLRSDGYRGMGYQFPAQDPCTYLDTVAAGLLAQGISVVVEWREGMAGAEIISVAREGDAGLICMTTEGRPEQFPGSDRSVAAEVIRGAPCPVYVRRMSRNAAKR